MKLRVGVLVLLLVLAAGPPKAGASSQEFEDAFVKWVPRLVADQKRVFAMTRTYLRSPDDPGNVLLVLRRQYRADIDRMQTVIRNIPTRGRAVRRAWLDTVIGLRKLEEGALTWGRFLREHNDYVKDGRDVLVSWDRVLALHDEAERDLNAGWRLLRLANVGLGNALTRRRTVVPAAPDPSRPALADPIVGDWTAGGGVIRITATAPDAFQGVLVKTYTFCRSGSVPLGQVETVMRRTDAGKYTGTVRYYRVSTCEYIGDAQGATWEYRAVDDTLLACSSSPNPSFPGGGCEVETRVPA